LDPQEQLALCSSDNLAPDPGAFVELLGSKQRCASRLWSLISAMRLFIWQYVIISSIHTQQQIFKSVIVFMSSLKTISSDYSTFNPLEQQKKSRRVAGLLLIVVVVLHMTLAWYLINVTKTEYKKPLAVMEVAMLSKPGPIVKQVVKEPPPSPPHAKKEPIKPKPIVKTPKPIKKPVMVHKSAPPPKQQPTEIKEVIPAPTFIPTSPVVAPAPAAAPSTASNSSATAKTAETTGHGRDSSKTVFSGVVPLLRVPPKYPARAASRHIEGWVKVEFTIQTDGSVDNAVVVGSEPEDTFDDAALTAISKWKFKEKIVNGVAVTQRAVQKLQFKLEQ
jgi:periplasmic protein TonB